MPKKEKLLSQLIWTDRTEEMYSKVHGMHTVEVVGDTDNRIRWLIHGDNMQVLSTLVYGPLRKEIEKAGGVKMIYSDPPFEVGNDFYMSVPVGEKKKTVKELAYRDKWNGHHESYLTMIYVRLRLMHQLLADDGCLLFHCDWRLNSKIRLILDEIFGAEHFVNEIIWSYRSGGVSKTESLPRKHDSILLFRKSKKFKIRPLKERQYLQKAFMGSKTDSEGRIYVDTLLRDVLEGEINVVRGDRIEKYNTRPVLNLSKERIDYPTQKPEGLLRLLIELTTQKGDVVADFFCGSGSTLVSAQQLDRPWIGCDRSALAAHTAFKRILSSGDEGIKLYRMENVANSVNTNFEYKAIAESGQFFIELTDFKSSSLEKRSLKRWHDRIDYWAIDFDYNPKNGFRGHWRDFRTKSKRLLRFKINGFKKSGTGRMAIRVVGISGDDCIGILKFKTKIGRVFTLQKKL